MSTYLTTHFYRCWPNTFIMSSSRIDFSCILIALIIIGLLLTSLGLLTPNMSAVRGQSGTNMSANLSSANFTSPINASLVLEGNITKLDKHNRTVFGSGSEAEEKKNIEDESQLTKSEESNDNKKDNVDIKKTLENCIPDPDNPSSCETRVSPDDTKTEEQSKIQETNEPKKGNPPIADAGPDLTIKNGKEVNKLDGTGSKDPDGLIVSYDWQPKDSEDGCTSLELNNGDKSIATIINDPDIHTRDCNYVYELKVKDDTGLEDSDTVRIKVECISGSSTNIVSPCANEIQETQLSKPNEAIEDKNEQLKLPPSLSQECPVNYHMDIVRQVCISNKERPVIPSSIQPTENNTLSSNKNFCDPNTTSCTQTSSGLGVAAPPKPASAPALPRPCTVPTSEEPKVSAESPSLESRPHNCPVLHVNTHVAWSAELDGRASDIEINILGTPELRPDPAEFQGSERGLDITLNPNIRYVASADIPEEYIQIGYEEHPSPECHGTMPLNQRKTCNIVISPPRMGSGAGSDGGPSFGNWLYVVINVQGGEKLPTDFRVQVTGNNPSPSSFTGDSATAPTGMRVDLNQGSYSVRPENVDGYSVRIEGDCEGTMPVSGGIKRCTVTNRSQEICNADNPCISRPGSNSELADTFSSANTGSSLQNGAQTIRPQLGAEFIRTPKPCVPSMENESLPCLEEEMPTSTLNLTSDLPTNVRLNVNVFNNDDLVKALTLEGKSTTSIELVPGSYVVEAERIGNLAIFSGDCQDTRENKAKGTIGSSESQNCLISLTHEVTESSEMVTQAQKVEPQLSIPGAATLVVKVNVLNGQGGKCSPSSCFRFAIIGMDKPAFAGSESGTTFTIPVPVPSTGYEVTDQPTPAYYRNAYVEYKSRDCSGTIKAGQTKTCVITLDDKEMRASLISKVRYIHDTVSRAASDVRIALKSPFILKQCCPSPEQLTGNPSIGGVSPLLGDPSQFIYGSEEGTEIKFWSMDFPQPNSGGLSFSIRTVGGLSSEAHRFSSIDGCGEGDGLDDTVILHAGDTKECIITINDRP